MLEIEVQVAERIVELAQQYADEIVGAIGPWSLTGQDLRDGVTGALLSFLSDALTEGVSA